MQPLQICIGPTIRIGQTECIQWGLTLWFSRTIKSKLQTLTSFIHASNFVSNSLDYYFDLYMNFLLL